MNYVFSLEEKVWFGVYTWEPDLSHTLSLCFFSSVFFSSLRNHLH